MEESRSDIQTVLNLAFEIISMLTGQVFTTLKSGNVVTIVVPSHNFVIPERPNRQKILEVTNKIIELMTGEVREYLEGHKQLYKAAMIEDEQATMSKDESQKRHAPESSPCPPYSRDSAQEEQEVPPPAERENQKTQKSTDVKREVKDEEAERPVMVKEEAIPTEIGTDPKPNMTMAEGRQISSSGCKIENGDTLRGNAVPPNAAPMFPVSCQSLYSSAEGASDKPATRISSQPVDKWFPCSECGLCFNQKEALAGHQHVNAGGRLCPFPEGGKGSVHTPVHDAHQRSRPFPCSECSQRFTRKDHLARHKLLHSVEKPFKCSECGKSYASKSNLIYHERTHTGEKPFQCLECDKRFTQKSSLSDHERLHRGEKPFKCSECGNRFTRKWSLMEHQRTHTGERPYRCARCGKCFIQKSAFTQHEQLHCGNKYPVQCLECGRCFTQKSYLIIHQRTHTGKKAQNSSPES